MLGSVLSRLYYNVKYLLPSLLRLSCIYYHFIYYLLIMNAIFVLLVINAGTIVYSTIVEYFRSSVLRKCYVLLCTYSYNKLFCDARAVGR